MTLYQFKFVRDEDTISSTDHYFRDDLDALDEATKLAANADVQIWRGGVKIARVKKGNAALTASDRFGN